MVDGISLDENGCNVKYSEGQRRYHFLMLMYWNNFFRRREQSVLIAAVAKILWNALILAICHAAEAEEDINNESSEDSTENDSTDYDDIAGQDEWHADDPYMPTDDYIINEIMSSSDDEWDEKRAVAELNVTYEEEISRNRMREMLVYFVAGSVPMLGLAITAIVASTFLYYIRIERLMRQYAREGVEVNGLIIASYPDINDCVDTAGADYTNNSYSMMTDDGSYQIAFQSESGSDVSEVHGTNEGKKSESVTEKEESRPMIGEVSVGAGSTQASTAKSFAPGSRKKGKAKSKRHVIIADGSVKISSMEVSKSKSSHRTWNTPIFRFRDNDKRAPLDNDVSVDEGSAASTMQLDCNTNTAPSQIKKLSLKKYLVLVEYDDVTFDDANNTASSRIIHKRLEVHVDDIQQTNASSNAIVKLHVLRDMPKSGYPSGDIFRSTRWQRRLPFIVYIMLGSSLVVCMAFVVKFMLPSTFFLVYGGVSLLLLPILYCFLQESFSEVIAKAYLENGASLPSEVSRMSLDKQTIILSLQNGTSFCYV